MAAAKLIDNVAKEQNLTGIAHLSNGRPPVTGLWKPMKGVEREKETVSLNQRRFDSIIQSGTKNVILVGRWVGMLNGVLSTEIDEKNGIFQNYSMVVDSASDSPTHEKSRLALARQLTSMLIRLNEHGVKVWLLIQVPSSSRPQVARDFYMANRFPIFNGDDFQKDTSRSDYEEERAEFLELLDGVDVGHLALLDPVESFYSGGDQLLLFSDRAYYRDEDHLTRPGADHYLRAIFVSVFAEMHPAAKPEQNQNANKAVDSTR